MAGIARATTFTLDQKPVAPDSVGGEEFGRRVALDNGLALISAPFDTENAGESGAAYLFDANTGNFIRKFLAPDGAPLDRFGNSVALDNELALIGSLLSRNSNTSARGSAYLFDANTGDFLLELTPASTSKGSRFGISASLDKGLGLIGQQFDGRGSGSGSAYLFDMSTGN